MISHCLGGCQSPESCYRYRPTTEASARYLEPTWNKDGDCLVFIPYADEGHEPMKRANEG